jgi:hypothetical protein
MKRVDAFTNFIVSGIRENLNILEKHISGGKYYFM